MDMLNTLESLTVKCTAHRPVNIEEALGAP
jgi:hypothetical protein